MINVLSYLISSVGTS